MSNLTNNTTSLQEILDAVNALPDAGGGITPEGTLSITENGTYDVTEYETATVDVVGESGSWPITVSASGIVLDVPKSGAPTSMTAPQFSITTSAVGVLTEST